MPDNNRYFISATKLQLSSMAYLHQNGSCQLAYKIDRILKGHIFHPDRINQLFFQKRDRFSDSLLFHNPYHQLIRNTRKQLLVVLLKELIEHLQPCPSQRRFARLYYRIQVQVSCYDL